MRPIQMNKEAEDKMLKLFFEKFQKEWKNYKENVNEKKFTFSIDFSEPLKDKIEIMFTPQAFLRMHALVDFYSTEVGWYGLVEKLDDKLYRVYDVKICKQYVNGSKVDTEDEDTLEFFNTLTDEEAEDMHFQAHSHVKMSTEASGVDLQNQLDVVRNMGKKGFYIFQIWNKNEDINTYLYDLDNNMFYDKKDIIITIEDGNETIADWVAKTKLLVQEKKVKTYYPATYYDKGKEVKKDPVYLQDNYWDGTHYDPRWDW